MTNENDLMQKLMVSKKIMDIHNKVPRGQTTGNYNISNPELQEFTAPTANYNIPQELMVESKPQTSTRTEVPTKDRILQSKLPDEIKRLMIEHPIQQPNNMGGGGSVLSNELVEKAARLMNNDIANNVNPYQPKKQQVQENSSSQITTSSLDKNTLKDIIRETIEEVLSENGLLVESTSKTNDVFQFRVGSHIFEGKVTKIKKIK
jgi:DUF917 family protein